MAFPTSCVFRDVEVCAFMMRDEEAFADAEEGDGVSAPAQQQQGGGGGSLAMPETKRIAVQVTQFDGALWVVVTEAVNPQLGCIATAIKPYAVANASYTSAAPVSAVPLPSGERSEGGAEEWSDVAA